MSDKLHDLLRELQWLIPAVITLYGVIDGVLGLGYIGKVETIGAAIVAFIGVIVQHDSKTYFDTKDIVDKVVEDHDPESEEL